MVIGSWENIHCLHRPEDFFVIKKIIEEIKPKNTIELGTYFGGFTGILSDMVKPWGGIVHTFDVKKVKDNRIDEMLKKCGNVIFYEEDVIGKKRSKGIIKGVTNKKVVELISDGIVALYCDNGDKNIELEIYAPYLNKGSIIGTHDYGTECIIDRAEKFMEKTGFKQFHHNKFAVLAHPVNYPHSLTRFWIREDIK